MHMASTLLHGASLAQNQNTERKKQQEIHTEYREGEIYMRKYASIYI